MRLMESAPTGPACKFGDAHIYYVLYVLSAEDRGSRGDLSERMGIGEGSMRGIVNMLKEWGLIDVTRRGMTLTKRGGEFLEKLPMRLVDVPHSGSVPGGYQRGVLINGCSERFTDGLYQRDTAVIAGAAGAAVLCMRNGSLMLGNRTNLDARDPAYAEDVRRMTGISEGDVLIIAGASDPDTASVSAAAAGLDML